MWRFEDPHSFQMENNFHGELKMKHKRQKWEKYEQPRPLKAKQFNSFTVSGNMKELIAPKKKKHIEEHEE